MKSRDQCDDAEHVRMGEIASSSCWTQLWRLIMPVLCSCAPPQSWKNGGGREPTGTTAGQVAARGPPPLVAYREASPIQDNDVIHAEASVKLDAIIIVIER